mmetsp:Transcript_20296/g.45820  ORF Transcript_20296/g.45820 Transcript_20296/m.45820 type:complete len:230 (+) Transcript_20296:338-1027(+)
MAIGTTARRPGMRDMRLVPQERKRATVSSDEAMMTIPQRSREAMAAGGPPKPRSLVFVAPEISRRSCGASSTSPSLSRMSAASRARSTTRRYGLAPATWQRRCGAAPATSLWRSSAGPPRASRDSGYSIARSSLRWRRQSRPHGEACRRTRWWTLCGHWPLCASRRPRCSMLGRRHWMREPSHGSGRHSSPTWPGRRPSWRWGKPADFSNASHWRWRRWTRKAWIGGRV